MKRSFWLMGIGLALMTVPGVIDWYMDPDIHRRLPAWMMYVSALGLALFAWGFPRKKD